MVRKYNDGLKELGDRFSNRDEEKYSHPCLNIDLTDKFNEVSESVIYFIREIASFMRMGSYGAARANRSYLYGYLDCAKVLLDSASYRCLSKIVSFNMAKYKLD